jgi:hypothetical protein
MPYVCRKLSDKIKVIVLLWRGFGPFMLEGVCDGLVVGEDDEVARFQHMAEMLYGLVDGQLLTVVAVLSLARVKFFREKGEALPGVLDALL